MPSQSPMVCVIGGGPAGLMAADVLLNANVRVALFDAMPSLGRKFLMAGKSGLNLTHAEPFEQFTTRYGKREAILAPMIKQFGPNELRAWAEGLGTETFVGTSQRVFPKSMKAAPLLRAWLHDLRTRGLEIYVRHCWRGWNEQGELSFDTPNGAFHIQPNATLLALGGASWPQLGSTGQWQQILSEKKITLSPLRPANCGLNVDWSDYLRQHHSGEAVKSVALSLSLPDGQIQRQKGEFVIAEYGLEGSLVYPFSASIRDTLQQSSKATLHLDLCPDKTLTQLASDLASPRGSNTLSKHLQRHANLKGVKTKLFYELKPSTLNDASAADLAQALKALSIKITSVRSIEEAISSAGGVCFNELDENLMLTKLPSVFCAGEMLDWEAPTGGYLFTGCFATGYAAGKGMLKWLTAILRLSQ